MTELVSIASQYGALGLIALGMMWWIVKRERRQADENIQREKRLAERLDRVQDLVMTRLAGIIESNTAALREMRAALLQLEMHCTQSQQGHNQKGG